MSALTLTELAAAIAEYLAENPEQVDEPVTFQGEDGIVGPGPVIEVEIDNGFWLIVGEGPYG